MLVNLLLIVLTYFFKMLRSHQACIDLKKNALIINDAIIPFLSESELPDSAKVDAIYVPEPGSCDRQSKITSTVEQPAIQGSSCVPDYLNHKEQSKFPEKDIRQLEALGFSREEVIQALEAADGDVSMAANFLF